LSGQKDLSDSLETIRLDEVVIAANRVPVLLKNNPGAVSLVTPEVLSGMVKTAGLKRLCALFPECEWIISMMKKEFMLGN
jgi:hypothetical protein